MRFGLDMPRPKSSFLSLWSRLDGSLRARVFIPTGLLFAVTLVAMVLGAVQLHAIDNNRMHEEHAELFTSMVADAVASTMVQGRLVDLGSVLGVVRSHRGDIDSVSLLRPDGLVSFSSRPELVGTVPFAPAELLPGIAESKGDGRQYSVLRPLANEARCAGCHGTQVGPNGWLDVRFAHTGTGAADSRLARTLWLLAGPALLLLLLMTWVLLGREVIKPIQRLVAVMRRAESGDKEARADEGRRDEVGIAARGFDAAMAGLYRSQSELEAVYADRMVRADRFAAVGEMASGLAHEIKNPLAGLSGALELLAEDLARSPDKSEVIAEMRHQVDRLAKTMDGLLSFARPARPKLEDTDVNAVIDRVLFLVARQRGQGPVKFVRELDPALPPVLADGAQLEQVFLNICLNACQALGGGGTITVRTVAHSGRIAVDVTDTGPGIPPEIRPSIFTPFFTTRHTGTGLGLAISSRIVAEHGGQLVFTCPPEGGTTFTVSLPTRVRVKERAA